MKKRVTGIGGVFFKTEDPKKLKEWYSKHLGFNTDEYGASFRWIDPDKPDIKPWPIPSGVHLKSTQPIYIQVKNNSC